MNEKRIYLDAKSKIEVYYMKYEWIDEYLVSKQGCVKDFKEEWGAYRYMLNSKMYCMIGGDKEGKPIVSLKCEPEYAISLREDYSDVVLGYYLNKAHWNSIYLEGNVPDEVMKQMIDMSYDLILRSLPKKVQEEIRQG